ncbi:hypothetical protein [Bradyrhizobium sp. 156]|uniref:hypothetical protein n=1 Tax=Bradyrhizobium sp. 156 TaxID=2782630 RepID=UPI00320BB470
MPIGWQVVVGDPVFVCPPPGPVSVFGLERGPFRQYPAGLGVKDPSEMSPDLFDACRNIRTGTALFGKVWRIVWKWYGNPTDDSVRSQVFDDAVEAWKRGQFEGTRCSPLPILADRSRRS